MSAPSLPSLLVSHWQANWALDAQAAVFAGVYVCAAARVHSWPVRRTTSFLAGMAAVLVALQSGIDVYDDQLLSIHMDQHMVLLMLAPLLLLAGRPAMLALRALPARHRGRLAAVLGRVAPLTAALPCLAVFYIVVVLTHLPAFYTAALRHPALHACEHVLYLAAGLFVWWPVLDGDPVPSRRLGGLGRLIYVLAVMPPMALVGAYLNRHPTLVYPAYAHPGHALGVSALADQQTAGAIMWVAGSVIMVAVGLWAAVAALVAEERRQQAREARAAHRLAGGGGIS